MSPSSSFALAVIVKLVVFELEFHDFVALELCTNVGAVFFVVNSPVTEFSVSSPTESFAFITIVYFVTLFSPVISNIPVSDVISLVSVPPYFCYCSYVFYSSCCS